MCTMCGIHGTLQHVLSVKFKRKAKLAKIVAWADAMCEALADSNLSPKSPESLDSIDPLING